MFKEKLFISILTVFACFICKANNFDLPNTKPITVLKSSNQPTYSVALGSSRLFDKNYALLSKYTISEQVEITIVNELNTQSNVYFIPKDNSASFEKKLNGLNETFSIDKKDYWVVIYSTNINISDSENISDTSQNKSGIEIISFNTRSENEQTITISSSVYSKQIGISDIKDEYGEQLVLSDLTHYYALDINFKNNSLFTIKGNNQFQSTYIGRFAEEMDLSFVTWLVFPSDLNDLKTFTYTYNSSAEDIDNFLVSADLSALQPLTINFSLPFLGDNTETSIGLQSNFYIFDIPSQSKQINYYGINNDDKNNYHAVSLAVKSKRIVQSATFAFDENNSIYLAKTYVESANGSQPVRSHLSEKQIKISAQSTFWEQSVSYLVDNGQEFYVLGFAKPYESVGHYSDVLGSSYKLGLDGNYKITCNNQILVSDSESNIADLSYETYSGDNFNSIEIPTNDCSQLNLEFEYDSYLNGNKYRSTSSFRFDQDFAADNAVGGTIITDLKLYEDDQLVTNSIISKINPRLVIGTRSIFFQSLKVQAQFENEEWVNLPEVKRSQPDYAVTFALPHSRTKKILNIKIIAGYEFETITHTLNGFAHVGIELNTNDDADSDGIIDTEDDDDDNDGIKDTVDNSPFDAWEWIVETNENDNPVTAPISEVRENSGGSVSTLFLLFMLILIVRKKKVTSILMR